MSMLPPVGWADVATKHDVERESALIRADLGAMQAHLKAELESGLHRTTRSLAAWLFMSMIAMTTLLLTALALIR